MDSGEKKSTQRSAPNKHRPPHRPSDDGKVERLIEFFADEYKRLQGREKEWNKIGRVLNAAAEHGTVGVREFWESESILQENQMLKLYEILGHSREVAVETRQRSFEQSRSKKLLSANGEWMLRHGELKASTPPGKDASGDPARPRNMIIRLALNFLYIEEIAEVLNISTASVHAHKSKLWSD